MFDILPLQGGLEHVAGFYCDGTSVGLKANGANDVAFIRSNTPCDVEAVFTTNTFQAAPIVHFKRYPAGFQTNFLLMNAKNANAMTGEKGVEDIDALLDTLRATFPALHNPIMSSTGVIGYRLNLPKISAAFKAFDYNAKHSDATARAIMTTDRFKKEFCVRVEPENGAPFHLAAICKGAGMINPAMATMLCFIITDAAIPKEDAKPALLHAVEHSFNAASVDGDTSTNDTVLLLSNGESGGYHKEGFQEALNLLTLHLAKEIVRDGEGATKLVAFEITGAATQAEAKKAAKALSNSLLVKTALFGEDPNWGRIASTIGASGITCNAQTLEIYYDNVLVFNAKCPELDAQREALAAAVMKQESFKIRCELGVGKESYTALGCDLGHQYVTINADYRT
jgi:glutamate N-acetyltransferase/amino-acid N-acetyltransferase